MARRYEPRHAKARDDAGAEDSLAVERQPGTAGEPGDAHPEQAGNVVTGGEALEEQQQNPDLDDTSGARP